MILSRTELISATQAAARAYTSVRATLDHSAPECLLAHAAYKEAQRQEIGAAEVWQPDMETPLRPMTRAEKERHGLPQDKTALRAVPKTKEEKCLAQKGLPVQSRLCAGCLEAFAPKSKAMIYCGEKCKDRAAPQRYKDRNAADGGINDLLH